MNDQATGYQRRIAEMEKLLDQSKEETISREKASLVLFAGLVIMACIALYGFSGNVDKCKLEVAKEASFPVALHEGLKACGEIYD